MERLHLALPASLPWRSQREGLGSKIPLKLMKATIIINILYTNSEHRNPPSFRLVWAWEMDRSRMSFPVPKEGLCWRGLDSKWQVIWRSRSCSASWRQLGGGASEGGEGIYSTVIEKGRLMCKIYRTYGWGLFIGKRKVLLSSCTKPSQEQSTKLRSPVESWRWCDRPALGFDSYIEKGIQGGISGQWKG